MKRGIVKRGNSEVVALWVPLPLLAAIDEAVKVQDVDRSKFIRRAIRNCLKKDGIEVTPDAIAV